MQAQQQQTQAQQQQTQAQQQQTQAQQQANTSLVLIESNGTVKTLKAKDVTLDTLYKKCGFRSSEDFVRQHTWEIKLAGETHIVSVWAKKTGKANFENKYDFPPPIDTALFFGTCAVVRTDEEGNLIGLTKETWEKIYEKLFGGFEDLGEEDEYSTDELEGVDPELITSHGYLKDDFVVSDEEMIEAPAAKAAKQTPAPAVKAAKQTQAKQTQAQAKQTKTPAPEAKAAPAAKTAPAKAAKQTQAKQTKTPAPAQAKQQKQAAPAAKAAPAKTAPAKTAAKKKPKAATVAPEPADETETESESELEEEVYTFSDEE